MIAGTLSRYFGLRFLSATVAVFAGAFALVAMIDFVEMLRRTGDIKDISAFFVAKITFYRVPFVTERVVPFAVLVGVDVLLPEFVAPPGAGGGAGGRRLGLAVHRARGRDRDADRRPP